MMMMSPFYLSIIFFFFISLILRSILTVHSHDQREFHRKISLRPTLPEGNTLHVRPGSSFKIAVFADLHFGEDAWTEWGPQQDVNSIKVMSTVLDLQHPGHHDNVIHNCYSYIIYIAFCMYIYTLQLVFSVLIERFKLSNDYVPRQHCVPMRHGGGGDDELRCSADS